MKFNPRNPNSINGQIRRVLSTEASMTAAEVAEHLNMDRMAAGQRLSQLTKAKHVEVVGYGRRPANGMRPYVYGIHPA